VANTVLKIGADMGLNLYDIGMILFRPGFEETESEIEILMEKTDKICSLYQRGKIFSFTLISL
jgi:hypothetical protein